MRLLCWLGIHDWEYFKAPWRVRKCRDCLKHQVASYDMGYGETVWENFDRKRLKPTNKPCNCSRRSDFYRLAYCMNCAGLNYGI